MSGPSVYVTVRGTLALVRGFEAERAVRMTTGDPRWSDNGRGWVISTAVVPDVLAYCQSHHLLAVVSDQTDEQVPA